VQPVFMERQVLLSHRVVVNYFDTSHGTKRVQWPYDSNPSFQDE
jgi:hypothetical protein